MTDNKESLAGRLTRWLHRSKSGKARDKRPIERTEPVIDGPADESALVEGEPFELTEDWLAAVPDSHVAVSAQASERSLPDTATMAEAGADTALKPVDQEGVDEADASAAFKSLRQIDYWAKLTGKTPRSGDETEDWAQQLVSQFAFPVAVHGMALPDLEWRSLTGSPSGGNAVEYKDIVVAVQLVHHGMAIELDELQRFEALIGAYVQAYESDPYFFASAEEGAAQAAALAEFVVAYEGPLEIGIASPDEAGFSGALLETSAAQQGLEYESGRFVRNKGISTGSVLLYEMLPLGADQFDDDMKAAQYPGVVFRMVPSRTEKPVRVVKEMLDAVKAFSSRVSGEIHVPGYDEYQPEQMTEMVDRVSKLAQGMEAAGLVPGGAEALRIFDLF